MLFTCVSALPPPHTWTQEPRAREARARRAPHARARPPHGPHSRARRRRRLGTAPPPPLRTFVAASKVLLTSRLKGMLSAPAIGLRRPLSVSTAMRTFCEGPAWMRARGAARRVWGWGPVTSGQGAGTARFPKNNTARQPKGVLRRKAAAAGSAGGRPAPPVPPPAPSRRPRGRCLGPPRTAGPRSHASDRQIAPHLVREAAVHVAGL